MDRVRCHGTRTERCKYRSTLIGQAMWQNQFKWHFMFLFFVRSGSLRIYTFFLFLFDARSHSAASKFPSRSRTRARRRHLAGVRERSHRIIGIASASREPEKAVGCSWQGTPDARNVIPIEIFDFNFSRSFVFVPRKARVIRNRESIVFLSLDARVRECSRQQISMRVPLTARKFLFPREFFFSGVFFNYHTHTHTSIKFESSTQSAESSRNHVIFLRLEISVCV